jgi:hypothetical protein
MKCFTKFRSKSLKRLQSIQTLVDLGNHPYSACSQSISYAVGKSIESTLFSASLGALSNPFWPGTNAAPLTTTEVLITLHEMLRKGPMADR